MKPAIILDNNTEAARLLADVVHEEVVIEDSPRTEELDNVDINVDNVGVWIDPIDSTAQYIDGAVGELNGLGMVSEGLQCVTVLIGVYSKVTGLPVIGVANQPFANYNTETEKWTGNLSWGAYIDGKKVSSVNKTQTQKHFDQSADRSGVVTSSSESPDVQDCLQKHFAVYHSAGAGYKFLCVFEGRTDVYVLSKSSTFKWDVCGPHAILLATGGGIIYYNRLRELLGQGDVTSDKCLKLQVKYDQSDCPYSVGADKWCNKGGIIAYQSTDALVEVLKCLEGIL